MLACETSRIWPKLFSKISYIRRTMGEIYLYIYKRKGKKKKRRKQRFSKSYSRGEEPTAEGAKHWALSKRQVSMLGQLLFVCMDVSPTKVPQPLLDLLRAVSSRGQQLYSTLKFSAHLALACVQDLSACQLQRNYLGRDNVHRNKNGRLIADQLHPPRDFLDISRSLRGSSWIALTCVQAETRYGEYLQ